MTRTRLRALTAGSVAALLLLPLSACGSDKGADNGSAADDNSPAASSSSVTSSPDTSETTAADDTSDPSGASLDKDTFANAMAKAIAEKKSAHMAMDMGAAFSMSGDVDYGGDAPEMKMTMDMGAQRASMILVDGAFYLQLPGLTPEGKWAQIDKSNPQMAPLLEQMDSFGPQSTVEVMKKGVRDLRLVGQEQVDGVQTDHYKVTVDTKAAVGAMGSLGEQAKQADLPPEITYDLYLDADNLMRRVTMDLMGQQLVINMTDWGKKVDVAAPPAAQVVQLGAAG
ncbi:MAG TPA: LppX_LprAFG lipoprotein [Marmoricola sp.]|nr:LppX_LprAFG lipoprotein [Marmoricola sp.]